MPSRPPLKAMDDEYGISAGHVETVHAFTNDQNLIDNYHHASRRGRSCGIEYGSHRDRGREGCGQGVAATCR